MTRHEDWTWDISSAYREIAPGTWLIDLGFQNRRSIIAAYLLVGDGELALIESGPSSTLTQLQSAVGAAGFDLADVSTILVTHIHLDHAGAAGPLARRNPEVKVYAHPFGVPHMVDPSKLISSASRIYEDQMVPLWGEIVPIAANQVVEFEDGSELQIAGRSLRVAFTPGHAWHHVALHDPDSGIVFTGDVGAVRMPGYRYVCPPAPPPDLDLDAWTESIARIEALHPQRLCLTHFGVVEDPSEHLPQILPNLKQLVHIGEADIASGESDETLTRHLEEQMKRDLESDHPEVFTNYNWASPAYMAAMGIRRYLRKRDEKTNTSG